MKTGEIGVDPKNRCPGCGSDRWIATNPVWVMECSQCGKYELDKFDDSIKETKLTCFKCRFYDTRNCVCMYKYACRAILSESKSAQDCQNYLKAKFSRKELEKSDYQ